LCFAVKLTAWKRDTLLADYIVEAAQAMRAEVIIPPKSNRIIQCEIIQREYDKAFCIMSVILLKDYSNKLKNYRQDRRRTKQSRSIHRV
jgi:hypothetical protein